MQPTVGMVELWSKQKQFRTTTYANGYHEEIFFFSLCVCVGHLSGIIIENDAV